MTSTTIIFDLIGRDGASKAFRSAGASAETAAAKIQASGEKIRAVGAKMTRSITLPAVAIGAASVVMANNFDSAMTRIQTQAGASAKDVKVLSQQVLALGGKVQQTPLELANSLYHLKSVGLDNADAMKALVQASHLAAVGNANLEDTTNALAGAWRTGISGAKNFNHAVATLNAIIGAGNMSMTDLNDAIGTGFLPAAKTFGLSLKDVGAALAVMTDEGVPAAAAATRLRMSFSLLGAPSAAAQKILAGIGISANNLGHTLRDKGLVGAIGLLKDHMQGLSKVAQSQLLSRAFGGGRSSAAIMTLINNFDVLKLKEAQVTKGMGRFGADVAKQAQTPQAKFKMLVSTLATLAVEIGNKLLPAVLAGARGLNGFIGWFEKLNPSVQKAAAGFALFLVALGPVLAITGRLIQGIGLAVKAFTFLGDAALLTRIQLMALWVSEKVGAIATKAMAAAQWLLNAALDANPIGLVVVALAALAAGLVYAYKHSATFREIVQGAFHGVQMVASKVLGWLTSAVKTTIDFVKKHWLLLIGILGGPIALAAVLVVKNWGKITSFVSGAVSAVVGFVRSHWQLLVGLIGGPIALAAVLVVKNFGRIKDAVSGGVAAVVAFVSSIPSKIVHALGNLGGILFGAGQQIIQGLLNGIDSMVGPLTSKLHSITKLIPLHKGPLDKDRQLLRPAGRAIMEGLMHGMADRRLPLQKALDDVTGLIGKVGSRIASLQQTRAGFRGIFGADSIFGQDFSSTAPSTSTVNGVTTTGADVTTPGTIADVLAFQKQQRDKAQALSRDVRKVTNMGLSKALVRQLESQGAAGAATLHALAQGTRAQIRQENALDRQTSASLRAAGMRAGNYVRGGSVNADIRNARKQEHVLELLEHHLKDLAHSEKKGETIIVKIGEDAIIKAIHRYEQRKGKKTTTP